MGISIFFASVALVWLLLAVMTVRGVLAVKSLPPRPQAGAARPPRVSVVIAARDEQARIETTVRRLLAQEGVEIQVIAVDDRSTDRTGEILHRVADADPRLKVLRVDALPDGWLGKCHALHVGAQTVTAEWLLFIDGDVWMNPDVIARAVGAARADGVEHVCLLFGMSHGTIAGQACHLIATMSLATQAARLGTGRPGGYMGIGAFNLVRAEAYRDVGGHVPLRLTVCDDWMLGLLLRRAGRATRAFLAGADVTADWFATPLGMVRALEKHYFAARDYRLGRVLVAVPLILLLWVAGLIGPWTGTAAGAAAGMAMLSVTVPAAVLAPRIELPRVAAVLVPLVFPVLVLAMTNSAFRTLRQGGIRWRDTFYPLDQLRQGNYR